MIRTSCSWILLSLLLLSSSSSGYVSMALWSPAGCLSFCDALLCTGRAGPLDLDACKVKCQRLCMPACFSNTTYVTKLLRAVAGDDDATVDSNRGAHKEYSIGGSSSKHNDDDHSYRHEHHKHAESEHNHREHEHKHREKERARRTAELIYRRSGGSSRVDDGKPSELAAMTASIISTSLGGVRVPLSDVTAGDELLTLTDDHKRPTWTRVAGNYAASVSIGASDAHALVFIHTEHGHRLSVTRDHAVAVLTPDGWRYKRAGDLQAGDSVRVLPSLLTTTPDLDTIVRIEGLPQRQQLDPASPYSTAATAATAAVPAIGYNLVTEAGTVLATWGESRLSGSVLVPTVWSTQADMTVNTLARAMFGVEMSSSPLDPQVELDMWRILNSFAVDV